MLHPLISRSPDLKRLWEEGLEMEIKEEHLLVHNIPYLNNHGIIERGILVSPLTITGEDIGIPASHVAYFIGNMPHYANGKPIIAILNSPERQKLTEHLSVAMTFSAKPIEKKYSDDKYPDYFEKITTYCNIISAPAKFKDDAVTEKTFKVIYSEQAESVFVYNDTNSLRARISPVSAKLKNLKIAIIGVGGTGSYILDLVAKTQVKEIHIFDSDFFLQHNAFRAPGAAHVEELKGRKKKVEYLFEIYSKMHKHIIVHPYNMAEEHLAELANMSFVFISIDKSSAKEPIVAFLEENNLPFIDVGIGVQLIEERLIGKVRTTSSTEKKRSHVRDLNRISFIDDLKNDYANIQIAELNALNAAFAVIKWKKLFGFYNDAVKENYSSYSINFAELTNEDFDS